MMQFNIVSENKVATYFRIGAILRMFVGVLKLVLPGQFVIGTPLVGLEVLGIILYAHVWALTIIYEQIAILGGFWPTGANAGEQGSGIADILSGATWLLILRRY